MKFFDRKYLLQIGDTALGKGLNIDELQVTFSVKKTINNKDTPDTCSITITNLSEESIVLTETDFSVTSLYCGYQGQLIRLFYGQTRETATTKKGTDRVTKIEISPYATELTHQIISKIIPENGTVRDVIEVIRRSTPIARGVYNGDNLDSVLVYGYPLSGTPKSMLDQVCHDYELQWRIDGESLYINDSNSVENSSEDLAVVISPETGLIDKPYFFSGSDTKSKDDEKAKKGVRFTALLNPNVRPGSLVKIKYKGVQTYVKIEEVEYKGDFRGDSWYIHCTCSLR
jgi:hypothetical protein